MVQTGLYDGRVNLTNVIRVRVYTGQELVNKNVLLDNFTRKQPQ